MQTEFRPWQSFADLAVGLMAVFALALIVLLWRQGQELDDVREEAERLEREQRAFAVALLQILEKTRTIVGGQENAEAWLRQRFEESDCLLRVTEGGELRMLSDDGTGRIAELYEPGETRLNEAGQAALRSCRENFLTLAYALAPEQADPGSLAPSAPELVDCAAIRDAVRRKAHKEDGAAIEHLRKGLEALVLEGNTDRDAPGGKLDRKPIRPIIQGKRSRLLLARSSRSFVENSLLGAERARQALGHLLQLVEACDVDESDALEVMMSRVRVESPSFGRYLAGPADWRQPGCDGDENCDAARNLSLRVRWRKEELRKPYYEFRSSFCEMLARQDSALVKGLVADGRDPSALAALHCANNQAP